MKLRIVVLQLFFPAVALAELSIAESIEWMVADSDLVVRARFLGRVEIDVGDRVDGVLRIHPVADIVSELDEFVPPQITQVSVEEVTSPLFGGDEDAESTSASATDSLAER